MEIKRDITAALLEWEQRPERKPLIIQGARQIGKTWIMRKFGEEYFDHVAYFNFDASEELCREFENTKNPERLIDILRLYTEYPIEPGRTLIIFDEIQQSNKALNSLKYFCEEAPEYHILAAGSLLGVSLSQGDSFPVGKVEFLKMYPVTFREFLRADTPRMYEYLENLTEIAPLPEIVMGCVAEAYRRYQVCGGMPAAVAAMLDKRGVQDVALAKKAVYGNVSIDSIAGPSEILVLADETANPRYVAADLLSQAEHDEMASAILVTTSEELAHKVSDEIDGFLNQLSRKEIMEKSLDSFGYILVASDMKEAIDTANAIASEHMEIMTANPFDVMTRIKNAGAIFIGAYSCEPLGDYFAGPNHVLPTNGTAKFFSPLSVDDFIKKSSVIYYSREALEPVHKDIEFFANQEQLTAHANSMKVRFEDNQEG